jgi:L-arabinose isomerase
MLDMYSDFTAQSIQLGTHIELVEMCDLHKRLCAVREEAIEAKLDETNKMFVIAKDPPGDPLAKTPTNKDLTMSVRVACALDQMVDDFCLDGLAYYYRGTDENEYEQLAASLILGSSLLTSRGIPCAGEGDLKTCFTMYIMEMLGAGGAFTEFYAMDLDEHFMLMAHDGPGNIAISDRAPMLRGLGLYHGKRGSGVSVEFSVKTGPVTILGMTQNAEGRLRLVVAEGEAIPGPVLRIGNTCSRIRFNSPPAEFLREWTSYGPTHHVALGIGHVSEAINYVARLMNLELAKLE